MNEDQQKYIAPDRPRRNGSRALAGSLLAAVVLSALGLALFRDFVAAFDRPVPAAPPRVDVIVVLSGGTGRLDEGLRLLQEERAPILYLVGFQSNAVAARLASDAPAAALADAGRILVEPRSGSTLEDAERTRALIAERDVRAILLITSVYHIRRANLTFRTILPRAVAVYPRPVRAAAFRTGDWREDEPSRRVVAAEFLKYLYYRVRLTFHDRATN